MKNERIQYPKTNLTKEIITTSGAVTKFTKVDHFVTPIYEERKTIVRPVYW